jgi:hypothetical protein
MINPVVITEQVDVTLRSLEILSDPQHHLSTMIRIAVDHTYDLQDQLL